MSKKLESGQPAVSWPSAYVIEDYLISRLEGRLLTMIESIGLKDTQEKAVKDLVRSEVWQTLTQPCFIISSEDHTALRIKYQGQSNVGNVPARM
jgi:hypothetical protein